MKQQNQQNIEQQRAQQQQLLQQQQLQQQMQQQKLQQQQLQQQKLQQIKQQQLQQQKLQQQQRIQIQQQRINPQYRPSQPSQNAYQYARAYSDKINVNPNFASTQKIPSNKQPFQIHTPISKSPSRNLFRNNLNLPKRDPVVQKAYKISGTLRRRQMAQNNKLILATKKIQNCWRSHLIKKRFEQIKPQLLSECEKFLSLQYELCDKAGQVLSDDDFSLEGFKKFYPANDPFFNFNKGFVIPYGIKIRHANDPEKVQVYEGDININNERHGYGRLTTTKSVFLGE